MSSKLNSNVDRALKSQRSTQLLHSEKQEGDTAELAQYESGTSVRSAHSKFSHSRYSSLNDDHAQSNIGMIERKSLNDSIKQLMAEKIQIQYDFKQLQLRLLHAEESREQRAATHKPKCQACSQNLKMVEFLTTKLKESNEVIRKLKKQRAKVLNAGTQTRASNPLKSAGLQTDWSGCSCKWGGDGPQKPDEPRTEDVVRREFERFQGQLRGEVQKNMGFNQVSLHAQFDDFQVKFQRSILADMQA